MEKTIQITLAEEIFTLEEPASKILSQYLNKIEKSISDEAEVKSAVMFAIEKKLAKRLKASQTNKKRAITSFHVQKILTKFGSAKSVAELHNLTHKIISHHKQTEDFKRQSISPSRGFMAAHQFIGLLVLTISSLALVFITLGVFNVHYHPQSNLVNLPFKIFGGNYQIPSLVMLYLLCAIPLIFLIVLGASILTRKNIFTPTLAWFIITVWVLLIIVATLSAEKIIATAQSANYSASAHQSLFIK